MASFRAECATGTNIGARFVNTSQQTDHRRNTKYDSAQYFTRETQLCETRNQCWNTIRETWTQMDRLDLVLDSKGDYSLDVGPYEDSKAWEEKRNKAATVIQQYARRRQARCKAKTLQKYAKERLELYTALGKCSRNVDERMCVLGYIKWTVQEFDCQMTKELIQLIEREADLMYRNRPTESLQGLRQRILDLFLKFIRVPKFNPEAAAYQCVPSDFDHPSCQTLRQQTAPICLQG